MNNTQFGNHILESLHRQYVLRKNDIGPDAHLRAKGIRLDTESWEIEGIGHLCVMRMYSLFHLVSMETVVLSAVHKDVPLFNLDIMNFMGRQTLVAELYDTQLAQWPHEAEEAFEAIKERNRDLPETKRSEHSYDSFRLPCCLAMQGKGYSARFTQAATDYMDTFVRQLKTAAECSAEEKAPKNAAFADQLITEGGPAVNTMVKLFGTETAHRMIRRHMYGI